MKRQGFHTFVPLERVERPPPNGLGRPRTAPPTYKPLFWGYAFVHAPSYIEWHKLFSTYGVKRVFLNGDETPQRIPNEALVSLLYLSCQAPAGAPPLGINTKPVQPKPRLRILKPTWQPPATLAPQARARVAKEGHVLFGHEGLVKWTAKEKTKLLMAILGGEVEMLLDTDILAPV